MIAANESEFYPPAFNDPAFVMWMSRIAIVLNNSKPEKLEVDLLRIFVKDGIPSAEWREGFNFVGDLKRINHASLTVAV